MLNWILYAGYRQLVQGKSILILLLLIFSLGVNQSIGQTISGRILDTESMEPIANVNVSIKAQEIGTVSEVNGFFTLDISKLKDADQVRFSIVGYKLVEMDIGSVSSANMPLKILMKKESIELNPVTVRSMNRKARKMGIPKRRCYPIPLYKGASTKTAFPIKDHRYEIGTVFRIDRGAQLDSVQFNFTNPVGDTLDLGINVYEFRDKAYVRIGEKPIYLQLYNFKSNPSPTIDLSDRAIYLESDFLISIENYAGMGDNSFKIMGNVRSLGQKYPSLYKRNKEGQWNNFNYKSRNFGLSIVAFIRD